MNRLPDRIPTPNAEEVEKFRALYLVHFGVELSDDDALDQCTRLVQYVFLTNHVLPNLLAQREADRKKYKDDAAEGQSAA